MLASSQILNRPKEPPWIQARTVTLEAKPEQVATLAAAQASGGPVAGAAGAEQPRAG